MKKVLIANRGEIACRIIRTLRRMGIRSVAIYSEADIHAMHVAMADEAFCVGPAAPAKSYLDFDRILEVAEATGADGIHPGYGFLSENPGFAEACAARGIRFIGPTPEQLRQFGLKHTAREIAQSSGVPMLPGSGLVDSPEAALTAAQRIGFPVMLKSTAGGGGIGLQLCRNPEDVLEKFRGVQHLGEANFKQGGVFVEKFVETARHIEVQIFGDGHGGVLALGERDCSVQRRNQKVIEESPAPGITDAIRQSLYEAAIRLGKAVNYASAGTVEFVYDADAAAFYFLEVNTRLQVEHGVTEEVTGLDLVEWMIRQADGSLPPLESFQIEPRGHAIQTRIYAEDPNKNFQPSSGLLTHVAFPSEVRVDTWIESGTEVSPFYDPLIAKIIVHAPDRSKALQKLSAALAHTEIHGIETNQFYLREILATEVFSKGEATTSFLNTWHFEPNTIDVLEAGTQTSVQDFPGRLGYWNVGVPPSGPMDSLAFRIANRILGNPEAAAGLEITMTGPTLRFNRSSVICLCGAPMEATLDGEIVAFWRVISVSAGQVLRIGKILAGGARAYLAVVHGLNVPDYLGSKSTFALGGFGGHGGRVLRTGDVLRLQSSEGSEKRIHKDLVSKPPSYTSEWELSVLYGPHGAPDFFTERDIETIFTTNWRVHFNSNRTGVRLVGPKPTWARRDGGEAGLHPSNIHDNAYALGAVDFTGDMPILLGPDGPSLGGFVCPAVIVEAERWKMGQLKAGDTVRFRRSTVAEAERLSKHNEQLLASLDATAPKREIRPLEPAITSLDAAVIASLPADGDRPEVIIRGAGDRYVLVEYGPLVLDLKLRFRVHALMQWFEGQALEGVMDLTPGIRSLQVHFDPARLPLDALIEYLLQAEQELPRISEMEVASRIVHLPLSWDDSSTRLAIQKYMATVRPDAPWCPSNLEFIRRVNGLDSVDDVKRIVFDASYLVLGLGDVYLGAPVATPIDPRHRLVTTKYNPARTWTPENAVGIGGAYLCIYGMEGPGGYQFVGRTVQVWNRFRSTVNFAEGKPWLLRFFDQIRFYPVTEEELQRHRADFPHGKFTIRTEESIFRLQDYLAFSDGISADAARFKERQQAAFELERQRWSDLVVPESDDEILPAEIEMPTGGSFVDCPVAGSLWKLLVNPGESVSMDQPIAVVESMKMEIQVCATRSGLVHSLLCREGQTLSPGQHLLILTASS